MKENVLDLLMYLFENYFYDEPDIQPDRDTLAGTLFEAGFSQGEIGRAFAWLDELADQRRIGDFASHSEQPIRVFTDSESQRLDLDCRGFLIYLSDIGVLDATRLELVIDRLMALDQTDIDIEDLKWVVLMVLFNQPGQEANFAWMEDMIFDEDEELRH